MGGGAAVCVKLICWSKDKKKDDMIVTAAKAVAQGFQYFSGRDYRACPFCVCFYFY